MDKVEFLRNQLVSRLKCLKADQTGAWGVMNAQQMVEHLAGAFRNMYGLDSVRIITPETHLPKFREFLMSEKPFRPNTKNPGMSEIPEPAHFNTMEESIADLESAMDGFFAHFEKAAGAVVTNPVFGELDFNGYVQLLHKHTVHHLQQFGLNQTGSG